jgi:hypothetical protein
MPARSAVRSRSGSNAFRPVAVVDGAGFVMFAERAEVTGYQFGTNLSESEQNCDDRNRYFKLV